MKIIMAFLSYSSPEIMIIMVLDFPDDLGEIWKINGKTILEQLYGQNWICLQSHSQD